MTNTTTAIPNIVKPFDLVIERPKVEGNSWAVYAIKPSIGVKGVYTPANRKFMEYCGARPTRKESEVLAANIYKARPADERGTIYITTNSGNLAVL